MPTIDAQRAAEVFREKGPAPVALGFPHHLLHRTDLGDSLTGGTILPARTW
jgi:hypothetical protein